jgi:hypothetical protein
MFEESSMSSAQGTETTPVSWQETFSNIATGLKQAFTKYHPFEDDGDVSPRVLSWRDAIHDFPHPTDVLVVEIGSAENLRGEGTEYTLLRFQLGISRKAEIFGHGRVKLEDLPAKLTLLQERFGLDGVDLEPLMGLRLIGAQDPEQKAIIHYVPYNISHHIEQYSEELFEYLMSHASLLEALYSRVLDFTALYGLQPDPIIPFEELLNGDPLSKLFADVEHSYPTRREQEELAKIVLISCVPDSVRETFDIAKQMYILAYFKYSLFTAASHYAYLALEAAVYARWSATLPPKVLLKSRRRKRIELIGKGKATSQEISEEMSQPTHSKILRWCGAHNCYPAETTVDGVRLPISGEMVLNQLVRHRLVTHWEKDRLLRWAFAMRNSLSHREDAPILMPEPGTLERVAYEINVLFHRK